MECVHSNKAPAAIGPYEQGWICGNIIFTSGQIPLDPETGEMGADIAAQAEQCCKNVQAILEEAGSSMAQVLKTTCYLADMGDFPVFNEIYAKYFTGKPARSCVAVKALPKGSLCEVEAIAVR